MKKLLFSLALFFILSCVTGPQIKQYNLGNDTYMYFLPASTWTGDNIRLDIDFNFKSNATIETICNMSIKQKGKLPNGLSAILFHADSIDYPLNAIQILSVDSRSNMARISSGLSHDNFLEMMKSKNIFLQIIIDGIKYECVPSEEFLILQNEFQNNYLALANILQ